MGRYTEREYQVGDHYLSAGQLPRLVPHLLQPAKRRIERFSLGTTDLEEAKQKLNAWFAAQFQLSRQEAAPSEVELAAVVLDYWNGPAQHLRSAKTIQILLRYWLEWWGDDATIADVRDPTRQEAFQAYLLKKKGLSVNSVNRTLEIGRAAINRAWKRGNIAAAPFIQTLPPETSKPKGRPLEPAEIAHLYQHSADHLRLFIILALGTAARPEALCQLTWQQIDFDAGIIHLNPEGRQQTSKRRPTVKICPFVRKTLEATDKSHERVIIFGGKPVGKITQGWRKACNRVGMDEEVKPYSLRHTAARYMRMKNVPVEQIAQQLGHRLEGYNMTERYATWSPDYLKEASEALEELVGLAIPENVPLISNTR